MFDVELLISLPNNLSGSVHITNINKAFTSQLEEETKESEDEEVYFYLFFLWVTKLYNETVFP